MQAKSLHDAFSRVKIAAKTGNTEFANTVSSRIYHRSQFLVPKDTLALAKSGREEKVKRRDGIQITIKYGGLGTTLNESGHDYAIYVHEIPPDTGGRWGHGNKHKPPTCYKYLEIPAVNEFSRADGSMKRIVGYKIKKAWDQA
jgi:hypothetical protein